MREEPTRLALVLSIVLALLGLAGLLLLFGGTTPASAQPVPRARQFSSPANAGVLAISPSIEVSTHIFLPSILFHHAPSDYRPPTIQFSSSSYWVHEGAGQAMLIATLDGTSTRAVEVVYATGMPSAGSAWVPAAPGDDYAPVSGTLTFAPGETNRVFTVTIYADLLEEPDEMVTLTLSDPVNGLLGTPHTVTLTIVDDDADVVPTVGFGSAAYSVGEGAGRAVAVATLSAPSVVTASVDYATVEPPVGTPQIPGVAAPGDDYAPVSGTLSFAPGETNQVFTVTIHADLLDEPDEIVTLTLSDLANVALGTPHTATLTIVDAAPLAVQFGSAAYSVGERAGTAMIIVTLGASSTLPISITYSTDDPPAGWGGTAATVGDDYAAISGTLHFAPGVTSRAFTVGIVDDLLNEPSESVILALSDPTNAALGVPHTVTLTILDDDALPTVQFNSDSYAVYEGTEQAMVIAALSAASGQTVTVDYATQDFAPGSGQMPATADVDYGPVSGLLIFAPGETIQTLSVDVFDDPFDEPDETFMLVLGSPANATLGIPSRAELTIVSEDTPSPFALQIAVLHLVTPEMMGVNAPLRRLQAAHFMRRLAGDKESLGSELLPEPSQELTNEKRLTLYESTLVALTTRLRESGAGWARVRVEWEMIEPNAPEPGQPPQYVWGPYHDLKLRLVAESGVRLIATVADAPSWAATVPCAPIYPDRLDEFARFLTDLVNRYKRPPYYVRHWELVNEPDYVYSNGHEGGLGCWGHEGDRYAQMLAVAYPAIKAADPNATVLMGGVAHDWFTEVGGPFYRYFPDDVMTAGGGDYLDVLNFHYFPDFRAEWERWDPNSDDRRYGWLPAPTCGGLYDGEGTQYEAWGPDLIAKTSHFRNRMSTCFGVDKPVWVTELAEHGYPGDPSSLTNQARYVIQGFARGLAVGVQNITWYSLDRPPYDPYYQSLLYDDFSPKPAFYAYQTLTAELNGYEFSYNRSVLGTWPVYVVEAYVFENEDATQGEKTVAWGSGQLTFQAGQVRIVDRWGDEAFIADGGAGDEDGTQNGTIVLQLSSEPVFVSAW